MSVYKRAELTLASVLLTTLPVELLFSVFLLLLISGEEETSGLKHLKQLTLKEPSPENVGQPLTG